MPYESTINFTLDTICPWTYLAKRRLSKALAQLPPDSTTTFTVKYLPYQLYPTAPQEGEDKYAWYKKSRYGDSAEKMKVYETLMTAYGIGEGINYKFTGTVANTIHAHRVIGVFQERYGAETADKLVSSLYRQFFEEERHPSSHETLLKAASEAGIEETEARKVIVEDEDEGLMETKLLIREQAGNGIDSVPYLVIDGKRRDVTLEGCREVAEYVNVLNRVIKENA
jgi:predicted DsbA family dithiol-disulfide isomerase